MPDHEFSAAVEDYLKIVFKYMEWDRPAPSTSDLAGALHVSASSVSEMVKRLVALGLVDHEPYGAVALTSAGRAAASRVVRRHRLMETYLVERLGYSWDEVHDEAEVLEHVVSDRLLGRIDAALDHPVRDPHGDPIPDPHGGMRVPDARRLSDLSPGEAGRTVRISDADPELLRYFSRLGVGLGVRLEVAEPAPFSDALVVRIGEDGAPGGRRDVPLGRAAADALWVSAGPGGAHA